MAGWGTGSARREPPGPDGLVLEVGNRPEPPPSRLRPLSAEDAPRVRAHRTHARDGTLAPVLLWWVTALDGWLLLDGHDRAVAALAEGRTPPCVVLTRVPDEEDWRREARTRSWPLPGGVSAWEALAAAAMFQFPGD